jgi:hypothetical protein
MIKSKSARFLQELAEGPTEERGPRVVAVHSTKQRKRLVASCLEHLEGSSSQPALMNEWDVAADAMAHIEALARAERQLNVAAAAQAIRVYCGLARERGGRRLGAHYDTLHTQLAGLLLRVYILGSDNDGELDVATLRSAICKVFPMADLHFSRSHAPILA